MKFILIFAATIAGTWLGFTPHPSKKRPVWWIAIALVVILAAALLTLLPPIAARPAFVNYLKYNDITKSVALAGDVRLTDNSGKNATVRSVSIESGGQSTEVMIPALRPPSEMLEPGPILIRVNIDNGKAYWASTIDDEPWLTYAYVAGLGEMIRMINLHVPLAWVGVLAYLIAMLYSISYLRKRLIKYDIAASGSAAVGTFFTIFATITGMIWAEANWGTWWNWDPRETSMFMLLIIYLAYFSLRSAIRSDIARARLSSVYAIFAFLAVPFLVFVMPRLSSGLHPGSADDSSSGPLLSTGGGMLDGNLAIAFALSLFGTTLLFFWIYSIILRRKLNPEK